MGRVREASGLGKKVRNRENTPMGRVREASGLRKEIETNKKTTKVHMKYKKTIIDNSWNKIRRKYKWNRKQS